MPKKRLRLFLALLLISIILMTYQSRWGPVRPLGALAVPLNVINSSYVTAVAELDAAYRDRASLQEELILLQGQLRRTRFSEQRNEELTLENQRLWKLLGARKTIGGFVTTAKVISRGPERWSRTLVLDKGKEDSVAKDMSVITGDGLVGKILRVQGTYSTMLLVDDPRFSVAVRLQHSRTDGVMTGTGLNRGMLKYVGSAVKVAAGERLVTSGLDGLFPPGIPAGVVNAVLSVEEALFHDVSTHPMADTRMVEEVLIIKR